MFKRFFAKKTVTLVSVFVLLLSVLVPMTTIFGDTSEQNDSNSSNNFISDVPAYKTGAKVPTEDQLEETNKRLVKPSIIYKNNISKKRSQKYSYPNNPPEPNEYIASFGEEIVGFAITDSSSAQGETTSPDLESNNIETIQETNDANLPDELDNTTDSDTAPYFPGIGDQGYEGSCCCFSTTYYVLTYMTALARGTPINNDNSKIFSPAWTYNLLDGGYDDGSWITDAFDIMKDYGCATLKEFPYLGCNYNDVSNGIAYREWATDPNIWEDSLKYKIASEGVIDNLNSDPNNFTKLKQMLCNGYIMSFGTNADYLPGFPDEKYTVISSPNPSAPSDDSVATKGGIHVCTYSTGCDHAMTVVGYDDNIKVKDLNGHISYGAFKVANSWGTNWGDKGFVWFSYAAVKNGAWSGNSVWFITAKSQPYIPQIVSKFSINTAQRNNISAEFISSSKTWTPSILKSNGGPFDFNGSTVTTKCPECTGGFALDMSNIVNTKKSGEYLDLSIKGSTGIDPNTFLESFCMKDSNNNVYISSNSFPIKIKSNAISSTIKLSPSLAIPSASLAGGVYPLSQPISVSLSDTSTKVSIHYTTNKTTPTQSSSLYTNPITIKSTTTLNAIAVDSNGYYSPLLTVTYIMAQPPAEPNISPETENYGANQTVSVTLSSIPTDGNIYYTTDGSDPTSSTTRKQYKSTPILIKSATTTLKAAEENKYGQYSGVSSTTYTIVEPPAEPNISLAGGTYSLNGSINKISPITLSGVPTGGHIYYTTDGSNPSSSNTRTLYSGPIILTSTTTLKTVAQDSYGQYSKIFTATYKIIQPPVEPNISPVGGTYSLNGSINKISPIKLSGAPSGGHIYYTTDGSNPLSSSTRILYSSSIKLTSTTTLNAITVDSYGQYSGLFSSTYTIINN